MRVHTVTTVRLLDDNSWTVVVDHGYDYAGPVAFAVGKKEARKIVGQNAKNDQQTATQNRANSQDAYNRTQGLLKESIGSTTPGSLSPAADAQLASDLGNVHRVYNGMRATAFSTLGQRGFGNAPSGFSTAAQNGLNVGQEGAETGAFRNAQVNTQNQRNFATQQEAGLTGQQGSLGNSASGESTNAGVARSQMGSTAGDVLGGVAAMAPIIAAPFTEGASLAGMAGLSPGTKMWGNMGQKASGVGSYDPTTGVGSGVNPMNPVYRS